MGTYSYMNTSCYTPSMSPLGASARSPLCDFALKCAGEADEESFPQAINNWFNNVHLLKKVKGQAGTHIGKGMTAPYYFLYSHLYMARAVKLFPKSQSKRMLGIITGLMLSYQEPDGCWSDWTMTKDYKIAQTGLGLMTLWHLATADKDSAVEPPVRGVDVKTPVTTQSGDRKDDKD